MPQRTRDFVGYGRNGPDVVWPDGARLALSFVINFEEGSERSPLRGDDRAEPVGEVRVVPHGVRDLAHESTFSYGTEVGFWRLLELFDRYQLPVTFFANGMALEANPVEARAFVEAGHEPCTHGYRWLPFATLTPEEERAHVHAAVRASIETTGQRPLGWFSRGATEHTRDLIVAEGGFLYDCDSFAEELPYFVDHPAGRWLVVPYNLCSNDMKFWFPPGYGNPWDFHAQLRGAFDLMHEEGASSPRMLSIGLHLRHAGRPGPAAALDRFLSHVTSTPRVWVARRVDIARWWLEHYAHLPSLGS